MRTRRESDEVLFAVDPLVAVTAADVERLKAVAAANPRQRVRLCAHLDVEDPLHDMLIVHRRDAYVRPHKHLRKSESFHVIEGRGKVIVFEDDGRRRGSIRLGDHASGLPFYYRLAEPSFHMLLVESDVMVFHEAAPGPFRRADTVFAPWAPPDADAEGARAFMDRLREEEGKVG